MAEYKVTEYQSGWSGLTYADVEAQVGKVFPTADQAAITNLITKIELMICGLCHRQFKNGGSEIYVERVPSNTARFFAKAFPVSTVTNIKINDVAVSGLVSGNQYGILYPNEIALNLLGIQSNLDKVEIYYTIEKFWGDDIKLAIVQYITKILNDQKAGGDLRDFSFAGYTTHNEGIPSDIQKIIEYYTVRLI